MEAGNGGVAPQQPPTAEQLTQAQQSEPVPQDQAAGSDADPRAVGTVGQAQQAAQDSGPDAGDPTDPTVATPTEQAQYTQLVTRFILAIHDMRPAPTGKSPTDTVIEQLNNPSVPLAKAIGDTTAQVMFILQQNAKHQKFSYDPDVMFHAADECIPAVYLLGNAAGLFKGVPPFRGLKQGDDYDFTVGEAKIIARAKLYAVQKFGQLMQAHGELGPKDRQQQMDFWHQQIVREAKNNEIDPEVLQNLKKIPGVADAVNNPQAPQVDAGSQAPAPVAPPAPPDQGAAPAPQPGGV